jgi:HAD superfamily hydrolase (TIGR01490 family)
MNKIVKVAIFDFDDTIFRGQSHAYYFRFLKRNRLSLLKKFKFYWRFYVTNAKGTAREKKEIGLNLIEGMNVEKIRTLTDEFYAKVIKKRLNYSMIEFVDFLKEKDYFIILASGGFDVYLNRFVSEFKFDMVITSNVLFMNNVCMGKIYGEECLGKEKSRLVVESLNGYDVDWSRSIVVSDHKSDMPIFNLAANKLVVDFGQDISWIDSTFKIIKVSEFKRDQYDFFIIDKFLCL